jgi:hypothetical protein
LVSLIGVANAHAEDPVRAQTWSLGGAALATSDSARITMYQADGGVSAGVASATGPSLANSSLGGSGLQTGGFVAWQNSIYRVDATLNSSINGQTVAGLGASVGAMPGEEGTRYGLRIGTAWAPTDRFTINPASGLGLAELAAPTNNLNVSLLVNHALTPNLNLIGLAEAQRIFGTPLDGSYSSGIGRLVVGAGIGYKF